MTGEARQGLSAGGAADRLGNTVNSSCNVTAPKGKQADKFESRRRRFGLRAKMRRYADRTMVIREDWDPATGEIIEVGQFPREDRFLSCGRRSQNADGAVGVMADAGNGAGFSGLHTCGSAWACAVCAGKIQRQRAADLGAVSAYARREKMTLALVTVTVRHSRGDSLNSVWDAVSAGWAAVTSGKDWVSEKPDVYRERLERWETARQLALDGKGRFPRNGRANIPPVRRIGDQEKYGLVGWARAAEVTHSKLNGWHVHLHVLMVLDGEKMAAVANALTLGDRMWGRWEAGIGSVLNGKGKPFTALKDSGGLDVRVTAAAEKRLAEYLMKDGFLDSAAAVKASIEKAGHKAAMETVSGGTKKARGAGKTPFQILDRLNVDAPGADLAIWREWVESSAGRRQLTTSAGLRELAGLSKDELTNEEIAAAETGGDIICTLPAPTWLAVRDDSATLLELVESGGAAALFLYLDGKNLDYDVPEFQPATKRQERDRADQATGNTEHFAEAFGDYAVGCWVGPDAY